jgi:hypothetical protein
MLCHPPLSLSPAPDAYRQAIEVSPRDYRAWYGLGQTYELLQMPYYALYYYRCELQGSHLALSCLLVQWGVWDAHYGPVRRQGAATALWSAAQEPPC